MKNDSSVNPKEVKKFAAMAEGWWDPNGKFKPLHKINPLRVEFIRDHVAQHFDRDIKQPPMMQYLNLLDVGCGGGLLCEPMARMGAFVTGIDATEKNINIASIHAENMGLEIDYRHATAEQLVEENKQYDVVLALEIIEHVADVNVFMDALSKLVKPGGLLFMSTLNRTTKSYLMSIIGAEYILRWLPIGTHDWKLFVKPSELHRLLRSRELDVLETTGMTFNPATWKWSLNPKDLSVNYLLVAEKL